MKSEALDLATRGLLRYRNENAFESFGATADALLLSDRRNEVERLTEGVIALFKRRVAAERTKFQTFTWGELVSTGAIDDDRYPFGILVLQAFDLVGYSAGIASSPRAEYSFPAPRDVVDFRAIESVADLLRRLRLKRSAEAAARSASASWGAPIAPTWGEYPDGEAADLVSLLGRKSFDRDLIRACSNATSARPVALIMIDIDHFKKVNDEHGHPGGDKALIGVADLLREVVGRRGSSYRYGGEELSAILPDFTRDEAFATAERFRIAVERRTWERESLPTLRITVSVGIAEGPSDGSDGASLLGSADAALYAAKGTGRNRTVAANAERGESAS